MQRDAKFLLRKNKLAMESLQSNQPLGKENLTEKASILCCEMWNASLLIGFIMKVIMKPYWVP